MKRGFTLIELMIVVAVLAVLMAIAFRLSNIVGDNESRTITITRMQRLENCLSGFHAAFGSYPPVKLHGNRSLEAQAKSINWGDSSAAWSWVQKVCRSQPIACRFPFSKHYEKAIKELSAYIKEGSTDEEFEKWFNVNDNRAWAQAEFVSSSDSTIEGRLSGKKSEVLWSEIKLFQFGLMSYLLPRYLVMMGGAQKYYAGEGESGYAQWTKNNNNPSDPFTGEPMTWADVYARVNSYGNGYSGKNENIVALEAIPAQAACARWMPNLEGICKCHTPFKLFGVNIKSSRDIDVGIFEIGLYGGGLIYAVKDTCFSPDDDAPYTDMYLLNEVTVLDGWSHEFYYYSRPPYQGYTLWSSGPDGKTFPPWVTRDSVGNDARKLMAKWTDDDIVHLSN